MKRLLPAVAILAFLILPQAAQAQRFVDQSQIRKVDEIIVFINDGVTDGCLPQPNTLRVEAEQILRRFGITVTKFSPSEKAHLLSIIIDGQAFRTDSCVGVITFKLSRGETLNDKTRGTVSAYEDGRYMVFLKSTFQERLRSAVNVMVTGLADEILRARAAN